MSKKVSPSLNMSEDLLSTFIAQAVDGIFIANAQGRYLDVNSSGAQMLGYTREEVLSLHISDIISENDKPRLAPEIAKLVGGAIVRSEWRFRRKDGSFFMGEIVAQRLADGRLQAILRDMTERKITEEALRANEQQLRIFVENIPAPIAIFDRDMRYLMTSHRWQTDLGICEASLIGRHHYEVFPNLPERWKEIHQRCLRGAVERNDADQFLRADGSTDWIKWAIHPWRTSRGDIGGLIIYSQIITERKKLEQSLVDKTTALRESLGQIQVEKTLMQNNILINVRDLILPSLRKLRSKTVSSIDKKHIDIIEKNLKEIISTFGSRMAASFPKLTPKETEICNLIHGGMSSKDIAKLLDLSLATIETHRNRIRKKLGISNKKVNLNSLLQED